MTCGWKIRYDLPIFWSTRNDNFNTMSGDRRKWVPGRVMGHLIPMSTVEWTDLFRIMVKKTRTKKFEDKPQGKTFLKNYFISSKALKISIAGHKSGRGREYRLWIHPISSFPTGLTRRSMEKYWFESQFLSSNSHDFMDETRRVSNLSAWSYSMKNWRAKHFIFHSETSERHHLVRAGIWYTIGE